MSFLRCLLPLTYIIHCCTSSATTSGTAHGAKSTAAVKSASSSRSSAYSSPFSVAFVPLPPSPSSFARTSAERDRHRRRQREGIAGRDEGSSEGSRYGVAASMLVSPVSVPVPAPTIRTRGRTTCRRWLLPTLRSSFSTPDFEVIGNDGDDDEYDEDEWIPDRLRAASMRGSELRSAVAIPSDVLPSIGSDGGNDNEGDSSRAPSLSRQTSVRERGGRKSSSTPSSVYTEEEEDLITSMGGKDHPAPGGREGSDGGSSSAGPSLREEGYLGDSTLREISLDYSIPVCYLADVLASWDVPVPIDVDATRLGDMVTGEQAFSVLEAIHTLDATALYDRYSDEDLATLCDIYDLDMKAAFEFVTKKGWSLPFGVRTFLRVEQEAELIRVLGEGGEYL